ncbi:MAG: hypothetical protein ABR910_02440 [Acidobacteriaceae bacterium]|jgi:hypothetical protein
MPQPANQTSPTTPSSPARRPAPLRWLRASARELYALFVDDGLFAAAILLWLALILIATAAGLGPRWSALTLPAGLAAILIESLLRASSSKPRR